MSNNTVYTLMKSIAHEGTEVLDIYWYEDEAVNEAKSIAYDKAESDADVDEWSVEKDEGHVKSFKIGYKTWYVREYEVK